MAPRVPPRVGAPALRASLGAAAFLAAHLAGARWGQSFALVAGGASAWYPPAGLAIAYLVLAGWRAVPVVALANFLAMVVVFDAPLAPTQVFWAAALAGSYLPFTALVRGLGFGESLGRQRDLALLVALGGLGAPALGALVGADWLVVRGVIPPDAYVDAVRSCSSAMRSAS